MHLFDNLDSGNGYKVRLLLAQLGISYRWTNLDLDKGETRKPEFLRRNPNGRIPTLELDDGTNLAESNAILWYLAEGTQFVPNDRVSRAQVLQWMFFEQYSHEPYVATPRFIVKHLDAAHPRVAELPERLAKGRAALTVMDGHLAKRRFFVADQYTIADIALYAYTHVADEGGHDLSPYRHINAWLRLVASQPRHVTLTSTPKAA
jgi:glutathione S-transferase